MGIPVLKPENYIMAVPENKRFQQYIVDLFTKFCAELEAAGYQFFYSIDDESMENVCKINEWEFLEDGTLFK